jgi:hypothetical protein
MWAKPLGGDLYEIQDSPWHSREINFLDVIRAIAPSEDKNPVFVSVERRSGHRTIQIILLEDGTPHKDELLAELNKRGATYHGPPNRTNAGRRLVSRPPIGSHPSPGLGERRRLWPPRGGCASTCCRLPMVCPTSLRPHLPHRRRSAPRSSRLTGFDTSPL